MSSKDFPVIEDNDVLLISETIALESEDEEQPEMKAERKYVANRGSSTGPIEIVDLEDEENDDVEIIEQLVDTISVSSMDSEPPTVMSTVRIKVEKDTDSCQAIESDPIDSSWSVDSYSNPSETEHHWELRRRFMQRYKTVIPEEQLVPLAQAFVNVQLLGTVYSPEVMSQLEKLGRPVAEQFHYLFSRKTARRYMVPGSKAANRWIHGINEAQVAGQRRKQAALMLSPVSTIGSIDDVFHNFVLLDDDLDKSAREFDMLQRGRFVWTVKMCEKGSWQVSASAAGYPLANACGQCKKAKRKARETVMQLMRRKCYHIMSNPNYCWIHSTVDRLKSPIELDFNGNPYEEKTTSPNGSAAPKRKKDQLKEDNIGYRMLKKLGWGGGPLGKHKDGIVDPIEVQAKRGRRGLGQVDLKHLASEIATGQRDLNTVPFQIDVNFYRDIMRNFKAKQIGYDLIFSAEFSEVERMLLFKLAAEQQLHCSEITYNHEQYHFVLLKHRISPHELLVKILVERHPIYSALYLVEPPLEDQGLHNKVLELLSFT
ncbi:uncharacterized protein LOC129738127 [Uranotaenia lowii]|uniref:uncharacterized protein LOC129738127 n=1 Tax=Uranotaenia lowii TaxID=190385 RepID=UPI0024798E54|nr:uncharacterized protein LOC129738127 [Uranotaenia lowii]